LTKYDPLTIAELRDAADAGITLFDTAEVYGPYVAVLEAFEHRDVDLFYQHRVAVTGVGSVTVRHAHGTQPDRRNTQALTKYAFVHGDSPVSELVGCGVLLVADGFEPSAPHSSKSSCVMPIIDRKWSTTWTISRQLIASVLVSPL
jgi:hypothetical protein